MWLFCYTHMVMYLKEQQSSDLEEVVTVKKAKHFIFTQKTEVHNL